MTYQSQTRNFTSVPAAQIKPNASFVPSTIVGNKSPTANGTGYIFYTIAPVGQEFLRNECAVGKNVMEIGAGYGNIPVQALKNGVSRYLVNEMEEAHIDILIHKIVEEVGHEALERLEIIHGRAPESLPQVEREFDAIMADKVIHFMSPDEVRYFIAWAKKALKKDAKLYLSVATPFVPFYKKMVPLYLERQAKGEEFPGHFTNTMELISKEEMAEFPEFLVPDEMIFFSRQDIVDVLERYGMRVLRSQTTFSPGISSDAWQPAPDDKGNIVEVVCMSA